MSLLISGPVAIDILTYNNIKIVLLSDHHFSSEGICNVECSNEVALNAKCYTANGLIDKIIKRAQSKGQYVDVYLESSWPQVRELITMRHILRDQEIALGLRPPLTEREKHKASLPLTVKQFSPCLYDRALCPYNNARFHYVDIRRTTEKNQHIRLLWIVREFLRDNAVLPRDFYKNKSDTLEFHLDYFITAFIIKTFLNAARLIESNMSTYYNFVINSDNFTHDVESYLNLLLIVDTQYIEKTINLLAYRYPEYSTDFIRVSINDKIKSTFALIRRLLIDPLYIVERNISINGVEYKVNTHRIRSQLLALELQGDSERAESLRQFVYQQLSSIDLSTSIEVFDTLNRGRMFDITNGVINDFPLFAPLPPYKSFEDQTTLYTRVDALMMDLYTLARMFRTYPSQLRDPKKDTTKHILPSYIIEYAGGAHIDNVREYFASIGIQRQPFNSTQESLRCLDVRSDIFD